MSTYTRIIYRYAHIYPYSHYKTYVQYRLDKYIQKYKIIYIILYAIASNDIKYHQYVTLHQYIAGYIGIVTALHQFIHLRNKTYQFVLNYISSTYIYIYIYIIITSTHSNDIKYHQYITLHQYIAGYTCTITSLHQSIHLRNKTYQFVLNYISSIYIYIYYYINTLHQQLPSISFNIYIYISQHGTDQ